jgi:hypothetical protein
MEEAESIERFIDSQSFSLSYDSAPPSRLPPSDRLARPAATHRKTGKERQLAEDRGGKRG